MSSDSLPIVLQDIRDDLLLYGERIATNLAKQASVLIENEYNYIIERFYAEYSPEKYVRHADREGNLAPGLNKTYTKIVTDINGGSSIFGGIEVSTFNMYQDYAGDSSYVLSSYLSGYHGPANRHIESSIIPYEHMNNFARHLSVIMNSEGSPYIQKAVKYAKKFKYKTI